MSDNILGRIIYSIIYHLSNFIPCIIYLPIHHLSNIIIYLLYILHINVRRTMIVCLQIALQIASAGSPGCKGSAWVGCIHPHGPMLGACSCSLPLKGRPGYVSTMIPFLDHESPIQLKLLSWVVICILVSAGRVLRLFTDSQTSPWLATEELKQKWSEASADICIQIKIFRSPDCKK